MIPAIAAGGALAWSVPWMPGLGVALSFRVDGLGLVFALLVTGIGAFVMLYAAAYFRTHPNKARVMALLAAFEASMLGLVLADNVIALFVFWEATTITSFLLIGFDHDKAEARDKALQALLVTGLGGLALLAGLILLGGVAGTYEMSAMTPEAGAPALPGHALYPAILVLVLLGCFTKSAQVPFHFWLPNAMAAPTPISAYLHSATMVKAGVYLMARLSPTLGGTEAWQWTLTLVGAATMLVGSIWAMRQTDLKLMLAYTTLMALGTATMFLGGDTPVAIAAASTFIVVHALYKAALFLVVGLIDKTTGTREIDRLSGLGRAQPLLWAVAALAALSMAGFPPFIGFIGKELKYEGALAVASEPLVVAGAAVIANALMVAAAGLVALAPFRPRAGRATTPVKGRAPVGMWVGPIVFALAGAVFGIFPDLLGRPLIQPMTTAIVGEPASIYLKLWHGINVPLMLSVATFALGVGLYFALPRLRAGLAAAEARGVPSAEAAWEAGVAAMKRFAAWQTRVIQGGRMRVYLFVEIGALAALLWGAIALAEGGLPAVAPPAMALFEWGLVALIAIGAIAVVLTRGRMVAIAALGIVGAGVAILFVLYGAVDVAMTQLLVETLFIVIVAVALLKLPRVPAGEGPWWRRVRWGALVIAGATGLAVTTTLLAVLEIPFDRRITTFFEQAAVPDAFGRNIVNVILVDFRALDTLGEIAVVVIAALAAAALLARRPTTRPEVMADGAPAGEGEARGR
ncbi:MAG: proton-conducting transporter membrane subunit [Azospirillaceae bacterium]